ncbi:Mak10 subunit, NatC N(alpha)-terminal acetyltransferase [Cordyceps fumosorosea ARSEF 2679]|uniref:Mak10 subunit, NatC N(Alpha)-terminal acetyltransferase n=1 Tax=Cordyceps fumosorosea (strain ARSEF 2679) TaxID=1081104 RepID=A0A167S6X0_CORFA|nr:Mak10 subunit, NatC N(alpha)-terminal acetyltransferase [Cordyceps fumosorosea ARSEF 2679]OAA59319.1 Mak10 subunit, NatC N(alpha)-terminal acetyltransferase [Cordyceps fumosorosea ARSEF 2679]
MARLSLAHDLEQYPPPDIHSPGVIPIDITAKFAEAVKTLEPGELVKDGFFSLFESVSALEIMDPKMDSGCVAPGEKFEEEYDVSRKLLPEEVIGIIDELICHEISWHLGYPLSQTLFTSVYVEALSMPDPAKIEEAQFVRSGSSDSNTDPMLQILRAYCLGLLKGCGHEEDFVTNTYNRTLLRRLSTRNVHYALQDAERLLGLLKDEVSENILSGLSARLNLRRIFLEAVASAENTMNFAKAQAPWIEAADVLPVIGKTHALAKAVDDAFSAKLQRKLASTMPPRPIVKLDFKEAFAHLSRMFEDGREAVNVLKYTDSQCLLTFVSTFQTKKPQPLVYVRTLLQTFLFDEMKIVGRMSIRQLLDDDLSIITLPASPLLARSNDEIEVVQDVRFTMSQQMEYFRERAAQPFLDILRTFCQNRCRIRRTLCHLIRDWETLQVDAEDIDHVLQVKTKERPVVHRPSMMSSSNRPVESYTLALSSWTYLYKLRLMETVVQLGFELEVYQPDEHAAMYWYLNYLAKSRLQHAERIKSFVVHRAEQARASPDKDAEVDRQIQRALAYTRLTLLDAAVTWELSDALACLHTILARHKLVRAPARPYSNDELRHDLRMKPFAAIGLPSLPMFAEFTEGSRQPETSSEDLLAYGERALIGARRGFEALSKLSAEESFSVGSHERWVAGVKNGLKSCIATGIAITTLQKALAGLEGKAGEDSDLGLAVEIPTPDKTYHPSWIVPKVTVISN